MKDLTGLRYFVRVVESESFSACARDFAVMPSSVTRAVSSLEASLGAKLLHRSTRRVAPTEAGQRYFRRARQILAELDEARLEASGLASHPRGRLRVSAPLTLGKLKLAPILPEFLARYPEIDVELALSDTFVDLLATGIDVAIRVGQEKESALVARKLCEYHRFTVASPAYLARHTAPRTPDDLERHACLTFDHGPGSRVWYFKKGGRAREYAVRGPLHVNDLEAILMACERGLGLALVPRWSVSRQLQAGRLKRVLESFPGDLSSNLNSTLYAVFAGRSPAPKIRVFVDFIADKLRDI